MSANQVHPRRRPQKGDVPHAVPSLPHHSNFRKACTFHSPQNLSCDLIDPVADACPIKRSETNPLSLEQILTDAGSNRVVDLLTSVENVLSGRTSTAADASILRDPDVLPVPNFMLDNHAVADPMDIDKKPVVDHHHASDSGLGSSVSGSVYSMLQPRDLRGHPDPNKYLDSRSAARSRRSVRSSASASHSAVTKSYSANGDNARAMSTFAIEHIKNHIVKPILREAALKDFHPLVSQVPHRIGSKSINNLRDLEKTLIFLAPVRRYAGIMAATRRKEKTGEALGEQDYTPNEKITLRGGLSHNGKPAELVRERNGKVIPIATESERLAMANKRAHDEDLDEDSVHRSMARRRKSERPGDVMHVCADCKKEFKRPCDLTKHEKTHSRPWKCPDNGCKYHSQGWPTEKERDRHVNDKHTAAPPQYKCIFAPCTYASKRESNCKQHMEKAHGWEYVRSKANGRHKPSSASSSRTPQTPLTPFIPTPASAFPGLSTPMTPLDNSPSVASYGDFGFGSMYNYNPALGTNVPDEFRRESITTAGTEMTYSSSHSPFQPTSFDDAITTPDTGFDHSDMMFDPNFNFNTTFQQPTPALSNFGDAFAEHFPAMAQPQQQPQPQLFNNNANLAMPPPPTPLDNQHLSPGAQPDMTLFQANANVDEGFGGDEFMTGGGDFTLFDGATNNQACGSGAPGDGTAGLFQDMNSFGNFGSQFDNVYLGDGYADRSNDMFNFDLNSQQ